MEHSGFPSDETLAAFIDGRLDDVTRRRVVEHMTTCDECYAVYVAATEMQKASSATPPRRRMMHRHFWAATLTIVALAVTIGVFFAQFRPTGIDRLVAATSRQPYRTLEGRLSGGFGWKPLHEIERKAPADMQKDESKWDLLNAATQAEHAVRRDPSAKNLHALGVSHLLMGNFDEAIATLQSAARKGPGDADIVNDLANAYLARGVFSDRATDYVEANELAAKAWALKRTPEIAWTRATAQEHLHLPDARLAWTDYLALDPDSRWSEEARKHLHELGAPSDAALWKAKRPELERAALAGDKPAVAQIAAAFPQQAAAFGEEQLLVRWAADGKAKDFDAACAVGDAVAPLGFGALQAICRGKPADAAAVRQAIVELDRGHASMGKGDFAAADAALTNAHTIGARVHSPVAQLASLELAASAFNQNDYDNTNERLDTAERELRASPWPSSTAMFHSRANWLRGLALFEGGYPHASLRHYEKALSLAKQSGNHYFEAALAGLVAQNCEALGDVGGAWQYRVEALRLASRLGRPARLQYVLFESTIAAVTERRAALSDTLTNRMIIEATMQNAGFLEDAHIWRARALSSRGLDALRELESARAGAEQIDDSDARGRTIANIDMAAGDVLAATAPLDAVRHLSDALRFLDARGNHLLRAEVFGARARAYVSAGQRGHAASDLDAALAEIEAQSGTIDDLNLRADFVRVARKLYTDAIDLAVASRDDVRAFDLAERSRAMTAGVAPAMSVERLRQILPADVALVEYTALPRRTVAWIVRREGVTATILPSDGEAISAATERMIAARTDRRSFDVAAVEIYSRIVAALRPRLKDVKTVAFIAEPSWARVPFAALVDPATGHRLLEDLEVVNDASAAHFAAALQAAGRAARTQRMLVCADPDANDAPRLLAARREGDAIGRAFAGASVLSGTEATREEFLARAPSATLIHFAGHARNDPRNGDFSALLFSSDGRLYAWEIRRLKLAHTRLVVLAACDTGPISDAFLAAGAPAAIATLWDIGDAHGRALMTDLYQRLHDGDSPSHALRAAQLAAMHDPGARPADWAGFELVGL